MYNKKKIKSFSKTTSKRLKQYLTGAMSLQCHIPSRYICENCSVTSYICRNGSRGTSQTSHYLVAQWQPNWAPSDGQELQDPRPQVIIPYPVSMIILFPVQRTVGAVCSSDLRQVVTRVFGQTEKCFGKLIDDVFYFPLSGIWPNWLFLIMSSSQLKITSQSLYFSYHI